MSIENPTGQEITSWLIIVLLVIWIAAMLTGAIDGTRGPNTWDELSGW